MTENQSILLHGFEVHSVELIRQSISLGLKPNELINGKSPIDELVAMYFRSGQFSNCVRCLVDAGAEYADQTLLAVLLDDANRLTRCLQNAPGEILRRIDLPCAFTPLVGATLLHVACEFGLTNSISTLVRAGADIEAKAAVDSFGFNGHTPIFHTVCQHNNHGLPALEILLQHGARADVRLAGITWGKGFPWETTIFDPTPISFAQAGLLRQFQRQEQDVYHNIRLLMKQSQRPLPDELNVPNAYLA